MKPFLPFESRLVPMPNNNIDTDQIIPARFLKTTSKEGLDKQLFCDWRYDAQGNPKPDFILNTSRGQTPKFFSPETISGAAARANMLPGR